MIIPNNKKYLVYIKTAKTGGTSFLNILSQIKTVKNLNNLPNVKINDIIVIVYDQLKLFKKKYFEIYSSSYFILISRNPYDKIISAWKYHPKIKNKNLLNLLKNPTIPKILPSDIEWKKKIPKNNWDMYSVYNHFYAKQSENILENNKLIIDYVIKFEFFSENIKLFLGILKINKKINIPHLNSNKHKNYQSYLNKEIIKSINTYFDIDFRVFNYQKIPFD